jgi:ATP-dependent DNA helicase RecQ
VSARVARSVCDRARAFLDHKGTTINPKTKLPRAGILKEYPFRSLAKSLRMEPGRTLAYWGLPGHGVAIKRGKLGGRFSADLVDASFRLISDEWDFGNTKPQWITCVPSLRHPTLVPEFTRSLAARLGITFYEALRCRRTGKPQKEMQNKLYQVKNLDGAFDIVNSRMPPGPVLLVDDVTDSGWTLTIAAALLRCHGSGPVFPFALARMIG